MREAPVTTIQKWHAHMRVRNTESLLLGEVLSVDFDEMLAEIRYDDDQPSDPTRWARMEHLIDVTPPAPVTADLAPLS